MAQNSSANGKNNIVSQITNLINQINQSISQYSLEDIQNLDRSILAYI